MLVVVFFPGWFTVFKGIVYVLRDRGLKELLLENFRSRDLGGLADVTESIRPPNFAAWRWSTFEECLKAVAPGIVSIFQHSDPSIFGKVVDGQTKANVKIPGARCGGSNMDAPF